jgi:hydroxyacylglutathione hydrolase
MGIDIKTFVIGPIENNTYLLSDSVSGEAVLIDPAAPSQNIQEYLVSNDLHLTQIWITHAHFDHIGGVRWFVEQSQSPLPVFIHPAALPLWQDTGGARDFGFDFDPGAAPQDLVRDGDTLFIGASSFTVLHTPGHTPGHVTYHCAAEGAAFCGDLIFHHGVGRTDLPGGDESILIKNITEKIFTLPEQTRLFPGHGSATTVKEEKSNNPFL